MNRQPDTKDEAEVEHLRCAVLAGLIGRGIQQSRTPAMHRAEGARLGLDYQYRLFDFDALGLDDSDLPDVIRQVRSENYSGLNITHPFKEQVIANLDSLSPTAAAIGAVNTVVLQDGAAVGHNTDCWGFTESFQRGLKDPRINDVVLIGAGGAGMAVARSLVQLGVGRLTIFDVNYAKAERLVETIKNQIGANRVGDTVDQESAVARADGLVNATPMGMAKHPGMPIERDWLRSDLWVADIVYFPAETELLRAAKAIGCPTLAGTGMAVFQAVKAFGLITGVDSDPEQMAHHFRVS